MSTRNPLALVTALTLALAPGLAGAQDMAEVRVLPGWVMDNGNRMVGVEITLDPGWKTYWRAPQGNGIPPDFDTSGSRNLARAEVHWPQPMVFETFGVQSVGYEERVIFPVELTPQDTSAPVALALELFFGICEDVCIPAERSLTLDVPATLDGRDAPAIRASYDSRSVTAAGAGVVSHHCALSGQGGARELAASLRFAGALDVPEMVVFESGSDLVWVAVEGVSTAGAALTVTGTASYYGDGDFAYDFADLRMSLIGAGPVVELTGCPPG